MNLYIIAGCNGSGKTTASFTILPKILDCREFVNADEINVLVFNKQKYNNLLNYYDKARQN